MKKRKYMKQWENNHKLDELVEIMKKIQTIYLEGDDMAHRLDELVRTYDHKWREDESVLYLA